MGKSPHAAESLPMAEGIHRSIEIAQREAGTYGSLQVDTEHLLLGLLQERKKRNNLVAWCLGESGVTLRRVRAQVENTCVPDGRAEEEMEFAFAPRLRDVAERAKQEARRLGHGGINTLHLFLALLEEPEGGAARIFYDLDVDRARARRTVLGVLGAGD